MGEGTEAVEEMVWSVKTREDHEPISNSGGDEHGKPCTMRTRAHLAKKEEAT